MMVALFFNKTENFNIIDKFDTSKSTYSQLLEDS